jgi:sulfane dehydrogenase subunit SoxC
MTTRNSKHIETVAGGGLLHRRLFLSSSVGAAGLALLRARPADASQQDVPSWMKTPGQGLRSYGERSPYESAVQRIVAPVTGTTGSGSSRSPLEHFEGIITPSALHFERHHSGVPDIPPGEHRLLIHGLVDRPLTFDLASLSRYPLVSRIQFIECSGNSAGLYAVNPPQGGAGALHGLLSCSDWTGVPLATLLDEVGVRPAGSGCWPKALTPRR